MEKKLSINWEIYNSGVEVEERYCSSCGKKVDFTDTLKRRQNANGKNIYHFAIYKCPKNHTWNKVLGSFKSVPGLENLQEQVQSNATEAEEIYLTKLMEEGIKEVDIHLTILEKKERLDKLLASKIKDYSRNQVVELIRMGLVKVNGEEVSAKLNLREKDVLTLSLFNRKQEDPKSK
ncbi:S4 domain-containing protein [Alkaliphilus hydrothermalis]|uniref:RNA-binding S4 domain-containing protein n=1 Tax=Alkaliphilus hydrothermalis TaxID=1482730 RepID=A0ABS2NTS4_9FIRM|nr:S4 domain-containing protein [Alkaliphilus hydrothermalis]MBM7616221.1 hypothetical protein [Alkaliphilus hydrothermalis]